MRKGRVYSGSITKIELKARRTSKGQNSWVPQVVKTSSSEWVKRHQKNSFAQGFQPMFSLCSTLLTNTPNRGDSKTLKTMEWLNPRCNSMAVIVSVKQLARTSKSGMVPPMAPYNKALFPTFFPKVTSPTAAPRTIWVSESKNAML